MSKRIDVIIGAKNKTKAAFKNIQQGLKKFSKGMKAGFAGAAKAAKVAVSAVALVGTALVAAAKRSEVFNKQIAQVATLANISMGRAKREVKSLSAEFGLAKDELTKGLYDALSAGVPKDNAFEFLRVAAKGAVAGAATTAESVDILTSAMNAFKVPAKDAEKVSDALFTTVRLGKTTMSELSASFAQVGPIAAASGVKMNEVLAATASLTKQGTPTAQAMTQIRGAIIAMNRELGDGWTKTMTLQEGMQAMADKAGGSQVKLKQLTGRVEGMLAILGTTGIQAKTAAEDLDALGNAAGATNAAFKKMDGVTILSKTIQTLDNILLEVGDVAIKIFGENVLDLNKKLREFADSGKIEKWAKNVKEAVESVASAFRSNKINIQLGLISAAATFLIVKITILGNKFKILAARMTASTAAMAIKTASIKALSFSTGKATASVIALNVATKALMGLGIAAVAIGFAAITKAALEANEATNKLKNSMSDLSDTESSSKEKFGLRSPAALRSARKILQSGDQGEIDELIKRYPKLQKYAEKFNKIKKDGGDQELKTSKSLKALETEKTKETENQTEEVGKQATVETEKATTISDILDTREESDTIALESANEAVTIAEKQLEVEEKILDTKKQGSDLGGVSSDYSLTSGAFSAKDYSDYGSFALSGAASAEADRISKIMKVIQEANSEGEGGKQTEYLAKIAENTDGLLDALISSTSMT